MSSKAESYMISTVPLRENLEQAGAGGMNLDELERSYILQVLRKTEWHLEGNRGAAQLMGLNPTILRARMRKYGILS